MTMKINKLVGVLAAVLLAGCATQKGAPIVDADGNAYGPDGSSNSVSSHGLGEQGKTFSGEELAKYNSMINDPQDYTDQQKSEMVQKLSQMPITVYFAFNSYYLKKSSRDNLDKVASFLVEYPKQIVRIEGHTDPRGSESYNLNLGQKRADSAKDYLLKHGVSKDQICTVSFGELKPAASPDDFGGDWKKAYDLDRRDVLVYGQSCEGVS
ncbi:OmpA family protein [Thiotrichales bacterium 19X7-9]|nr:OmpA family protein [Thiotrichales bacterium 19X7-9]MCF6774968.1 OmpA family protein [Thiotrichales bacterium 19X7-9]